MLKAYYHKDFTGHYPVGTAAVVIAPNVEIAIKLLECKLEDFSLKQQIDPKGFVEIDLEYPEAYILRDGNY